jgi:hypothetical protein
MLGKLRTLKSGLAYEFRRRTLEKRCQDSRRGIEAALNSVLGGKANVIPVFLVSYNNGVYVRNMTEQLARYDITPAAYACASGDTIGCGGGRTGMIERRANISRSG